SKYIKGSGTSEKVDRAVNRKKLAEVVGLNTPFFRVFNHPVYSYEVVGQTSNGDWVVEEPKTGKQMIYNHEKRSINLYK
ncbi:MAG: hypothetical protein ACRDBG_18825, partial [Waterburya sp.]